MKTQVSFTMPYKILSVVLGLFLVTACTVTGPADDGYENNNEWNDNGRILSNEARTVYQSDNDKPSDEGRVEEKLRMSQDSVPPAGAITNDNEEYLAYQQWLKAKDKNTPEYQRFQKWKEFEEFQNWKAQQNSAVK